MDCNASINALVQGKNLQETLNRLRADTSCFRDFPLNQSIAREEMREASEASKGIVFHQENSWKMMAVLSSISWSFFCSKPTDGSDWLTGRFGSHHEKRLHETTQVLAYRYLQLASKSLNWELLQHRAISSKFREMPHDT